MNYGFFRVAAAAPRLRVADPDYNAGQLETVIDRAVAQQVRLLVTPELSVTGYTCADLFFTAALQQAAGVPAGDQLQVVTLQDGAKQARFAREFIAQLEAGKTGLFPFSQTGFQRGFRAERRQIVVRPRQRVNA